jgi:hypothetical protein
LELETKPLLEIPWGQQQPDTSHAVGTAVALAFSRDSRTLYGFNSAACEIEFGNANAPKINWRKMPISSRVVAATITERIAIADDDIGVFRLTDLENPLVRLRLNYPFELDEGGSEVGFSFLSWSPDGRFLYAQTEFPKDCVVWDTKSADVIFRRYEPSRRSHPMSYFFDEHLGPAAVTTGGQFLALCLNAPRVNHATRRSQFITQEVQFYNLADGRMTAKLPVETGGVLKLEFSPSGEYIAILVGSSEVPKLPTDISECLRLARLSTLLLYRLTVKGQDQS